ncbi:MAG: T9SS type A sorting domain-containing protein [Flavobacterium sp.]|nr:T9SS type A sorting domain-containing protein [Flavobacterium sp.]MBP7317954.1 T9SS type A sorting domain-containing protein [Flavobacterium sp.]
MKKLYLSLLGLVGIVASAQEVAWQRNIKSNTQDFLSQLTTTIDGQFLLSGSSIQANTQQVSTTNQNNGYDFHVVKMNQQGQLVWEKYFGGNQHDFLTAATSTQECGFLLAGTSFSDLGFQKKNKQKGGSDIWLIKLDENGEEQWQKTLGTEVDEEAKSVIETTDLGYFVAGNAQNKQGAFGSKDVLLVKLDKTGKLIHQIYLGGKGLDEVERIIPTRDGGALVGIYSRSSSMENGKLKIENEASLDEEPKEETNLTDNRQPTTINHISTTYQPKTTENYGEGDFWVVKLSKEGKVEWQKNFGGKEDDHIRTLSNTETGFMIAGESRSGNSGNKKSSIKEGTDLWLVSLDEKGEEQWQKGFNFKNRDVLMSLNTINDTSGNQTKGFLLGGYTQAEGKVEKNDETFWMLYVDNKGEEVWRKYVEGKEKKQEERLVAATINRDGSYLLAGTSAEELGKENWKIVKLGDKQVEQLIEKQDMRIYPNPVSDYCYVEIGVEFKEATINVYDMTGKLAYQTKTKNSVTKLNTGNLPQGSYIVTVNTENKSITNKIVKK